MESEDRVCDNCGIWVDEDKVLYTMTVTLMAEPRIQQPPVEEMPGDVQDELQRLVEVMEEMSDEEIKEATDQVFEQYNFNLCPKCRREIHGQMKLRTRLFQQE